MFITAQGFRLRNDLYCVELDVKLYYTIPSSVFLRDESKIIESMFIVFDIYMMLLRQTGAWLICVTLVLKAVDCKFVFFVHVHYTAH